MFKGHILTWNNIINTMINEHDVADFTKMGEKWKGLLIFW